MNIKIYVATHKPYPMPQDDLYVPLHVGAEGKTPLWAETDATDVNISSKNPHYCELTGLYWIWKNADADYLGLVHYRRYFMGRRFALSKQKRILDQAQAQKLLSHTKVVLPKPRHYIIETGWSQYAHAHHVQDLTQTRLVLRERCPEYVDAFDGVMKRRTGHRFNMLLMPRDLLNEYCAWLFPILFELEARLDISHYSAYDARVFGFVGERLLDVWIDKNRIAYKELPVVNMESQHWGHKIGRFIHRKVRATLHNLAAHWRWLFRSAHLAVSRTIRRIDRDGRPRATWLAIDKPT